MVLIINFYASVRALSLYKNNRRGDPMDNELTDIDEAMVLVFNINIRRESV